MAHTDEEKRTLLSNLPKDLAGTYSRILTRILKIYKSDESRSIIVAIFKWVLCAERPLRLEELKEAITLDPEDVTLQRHKIPAGDGTRLIYMCGNLITLDRPTQTVTFAHHTVSQYILQKTLKNQFLHFDLRIARQEIAFLIVTYLSLSDFESRVTEYQRGRFINGNTATQASISRIPYKSQAELLHRMIHGSKRPSNRTTAHTVDLGDYVNIHPIESHQYEFLEYATLTWPAHTKHIYDLKASHDGLEKFKDHLLHGKNDEKIWPWDSQPVAPLSKNSLAGPFSPETYKKLLPWALKECHVPILRLVREMAPSGLEDMQALDQFRTFWANAYLRQDPDMIQFMNEATDAGGNFDSERLSLVLSQIATQNRAATRKLLADLLNCNQKDLIPYDWTLARGVLDTLEKLWSMEEDEAFAIYLSSLYYYVPGMTILRRLKEARFRKDTPRLLKLYQNLMLEDHEEGKQACSLRLACVLEDRALIQDFLSHQPWTTQQLSSEIAHAFFKGTEPVWKPLWEVHHARAEDIFSCIQQLPSVKRIVRDLVGTMSVILEEDTYESSDTLRLKAFLPLL